MKATRGVLAYPLSLAAIILFTVLLVFALWQLSETASALRTKAADNMLWTIAQAQTAAQRLNTSVAQARLGEADAQTLALRYDILLSRLSLLEAGPQRRYLESLGNLDSIQTLAARAYAHEDAFTSAGAETDPALHGLLDDLAVTLGRAANGAMVAQWNDIGGQLERQRNVLVNVIIIVLAILAIGAFICWRMLTALSKEQRTQMSLLREKEIREAYRNFLALVSHQFRTPLSVIDSSMQRIVREGEAMPPSEIAERAKRVRATVGSLVDLVQATLDSMKLDAGEIDIAAIECDLETQLATVRDQQLEAHPDRTIEIAMTRAVPARVMIDPLLFQQIMANLLSNALAYSPRNEPISIRVSAANARLQVSVQDRGKGIPESEMTQLFEPFFRASTASGTSGVGMGLHLSRRLANMLGGILSAQSRPGHGSVFALELPLDGPERVHGDS